MSIKRLPFLYFKGRSSLDFNLMISNKSSYNAPERDVTVTSIAGRNGDLITDNGRYLNIKISYELTLIISDHRPFRELVSNIKEWLLSESRYFELWDCYDDRYYRLGAYSGGLDIEEELQAVGAFTAEFNCKPFRYSFDGQKTVSITQSKAVLLNPEPYESKPYIKINGNGDINLYINNQSFYFTQVSGYIEIDSELMCAYKGTELQNSKMKTAAFPIFSPGSNNISYSGDVTKIEIVPRWCCL